MRHTGTAPWGWTFIACALGLAVWASAFRQIGLWARTSSGGTQVTVNQGELVIGYSRYATVASPLQFVCRQFGAGTVRLNWRPYHVAEAPWPFPSGYRYLHVPLWVAAVPVGLLAARRWGMYRARRVLAGACPCCEHPTLAHPNAGRMCPECGWGVQPVAHQAAVAGALRDAPGNPDGYRPYKGGARNLGTSSLPAPQTLS